MQELPLRTQADSAWKDILDVYFREFMEFFFPMIAIEIDWQAGYDVLDKELQALTSESLIGKRLVDKLVRVRSLSGEERLVLIHVEVQGNPEINFERRIFQYYYRLYDRYNKPIITLVILTDDQPGWRPHKYEMKVWDYEILRFRFWPVKLLDYVNKVKDLKVTLNPFGTVILAQLAAWNSRGRPQDRFNQKFALTRRLYDRGLSRDAILNLYKFIDWVLTLPEELEIRYNDSIHQLEEERTVSYITIAERIGIKKGYEQGIQQGMQQGVQQGIQQGMQQGIQQGVQQGMQQGEYSLLLRLLEHKFKSVPENYRQRLIGADAETLLIWGERVLDANTLNEIFED